MAKGNRAACLAVTFPHEGGYVDHPKDPGGATNLGITLATLRDWRKKPVTKADVRALTKVEAEAIYGMKYWAPMRCEDLPFGLDLATFDFGVNSGNARAVRYLQAVLGVKQDGIAGNGTVVEAVKQNSKATIQKLCAKRLSFMQGLAIWSTFKKGWSRRVADVEAKAVAMWLKRDGALSAPAKRELQAESAKAAKTAKTQNASAGGAVAGGGGVTGADVATSVDPNWLLIGGVLGLVVVGAIILLVKARHNRARADAYQTVSAE